jgi:hypothetical protein
MTELEINPDIVRSVIDKVHEFQSRDDVMLSEAPEVADLDWSSQMHTEYSGDPYYQELKNLIDDLEPDQQVQLVALTWVGRGDCDIDEWETVLEQAEDAWTDHTADYLIGTPLLADYLSEALEQFDVWAE